MPFAILYNLMIILTAGLIAGVISRRIGLPMVIGYLVAGAMIGEGGIPGILIHVENLPNYERVRTVIEDVATDVVQERMAPNVDEVTEGTAEIPNVDTVIEGTAEEKLQEVIESGQFQSEIIDDLAHLGALFLLFSIGIHFAPSELFKMKRFLFVGGPLQMFGVIIPMTLIAFLMTGQWRVGFLIGCAVSMSSTVLVFKSLEEYGQGSSPFGARAVSILLFQDVAIAPILLILPLLDSFSGGDQSLTRSLLDLAFKAVFFLILVGGIRFLFTRRGVPLLSQLRSVELMVLFTVVLLFGVCLVAEELKLPAALGALAAGVALSENRLSHQFSALTIPFRETFSAIFFVSLGALFNMSVLFNYPAQTLGLLVGLLTLKTAAGALAFRVLGLTDSAALAMGLGISQLGELSFIVLQQGTFRSEYPVLYQQILFVALTSIILTPLFLRVTLSVIRRTRPLEKSSGGDREMLLPPGEGKRTALVIGLGPIGSRLTSFLEISGIDVCLMDMNPVNLHPYAQEGFRTIAGDATEKSALKNTKIESVRLVVITIPDDSLISDIITAVRSLNNDCSIVVRCRYTANVLPLKRAGADLVICEESEAGNGLVSALEHLL